MPTDPSWRVLLLIVLIALIWAWYRRPQSSPGAVQRQRLLQPRTPEDCPVCRQQAAPTATALARPHLTPWSAVKSRRGAPKRIATQGFACPNRTCAYYRITDAQVHALSGDGTHGRCERIQTLRCQACGATCSTRRDTPLYRLKTASQRVAEVLTALAQGLSVAAAVRVFGHRHATITTWLSRAGEHSTTLHDRLLRKLHLPHIQLDELRTRLRCRAHILWVWIAIDPISKLIPVLHHPEGTRRTDPECRAPGGPRSA
jgi:transposase-like protein